MLSTFGHMTNDDWRKHCSPQPPMINHPKRSLSSCPASVETGVFLLVPTTKLQAKPRASPSICIHNEAGGVDMLDTRGWLHGENGFSFNRRAQRVSRHSHLVVRRVPIRPNLPFSSGDDSTLGSMFTSIPAGNCSDRFSSFFWPMVQKSETILSI